AHEGLLMLNSGVGDPSRVLLTVIGLEKAHEGLLMLNSGVGDPSRVLLTVIGLEKAHEGLLMLNSGVGDPARVLLTVDRGLGSTFFAPEHFFFSLQICHLDTLGGGEI